MPSVFVLVRVTVFFFVCVYFSFSFYFGVRWCFFIKIFSITLYGTLGALFTKKSRIHEETLGVLCCLSVIFDWYVWVGGGGGGGGRGWIFAVLWHVIIGLGYACFCMIQWIFIESALPSPLPPPPATIKVFITVDKNTSKAILVEEYSLSNGWQ